MALTNSEGGRTFHFNFSLSEKLLASLRGDGTCSSDSADNRDSCETEILLMSKCLSFSFGSLICKATQEPYPTVDMSNGSNLNNHTSNTSQAKYLDEAHEDQSAFEPLDLSVYNQEDSPMCVQSQLPTTATMLEHSFTPRYATNNNLANDVTKLAAPTHNVMHKTSMGSTRKRPLSPISKFKNQFDGKVLSAKNSNAIGVDESFPDIRDHKNWNRWTGVGSDGDSSNYKRECSDDSNPADLNLDSDIIHSSTSLVSNEYFALVNNSNQNKVSSNSRENSDASGGPSSTSFGTSENSGSNSVSGSGDKRQFRLSEWERTNFRCSICGKMFKHLTNVSRHKRMIHNANHDSPALCIDATENTQEFNPTDNAEIPDDTPPGECLKVEADVLPVPEVPENTECPKIIAQSEASVKEESGNILADRLATKTEEVLQPPVFDALPLKPAIVKCEEAKAAEINNDWVDCSAPTTSKLNAITTNPDSSTRLFNIPAVCSTSNMTPNKSTSNIFHPTETATPTEILNDVTDNSSYLFDRLGSEYQSCSTKALLSLIMDLNKSNAAGVAASPPLASSNISHASDSSCHSVTSPIDATLSLDELNEVKKKLGPKGGIPRKLKKPVPKNTYEYSKVRLPFPIEISAEERVSLACNVCNYQFTILSNLRRHKKVYGHYEKHICPNCKEIFTSMERFNAHVSNCNSSKSASAQINGKIGAANSLNDFSDSSVDIDRGADIPSHEMKAEMSDDEYGEIGNPGSAENEDDSQDLPPPPSGDVGQTLEIVQTQDVTNDVIVASTE